MSDHAMIPADLARALLTADTGLEATASPASVAAGAHQIWNKLAGHFARLIGDAGVLAILDRSISIASTRLPWLTARADSLENGRPSIRAAFESQTVLIALDGLGDLLTTFISLLGRFIGAALVQRLLTELWPAVFSPDLKELP